jgi:hypothetical protein
MSTKAELNALKWYVFFICLFSEAELYIVNTNIRVMPEFNQFEIGMSTNLYLPAIGTAGFDRLAVNGNKRVPAPPPKITDNICLLIDLLFICINTNYLNHKNIWG